MDGDIKRTIKSTQEQASAAWVTQLNQARLDELIAKLDQQDINLEDALQELAELKQFIGDPSHILGSMASKHGEIAEHFQVNISNARNAVQGLEKEYTFEGVGRTAPEDYLKNGQQVQSKFYNGLRSTLFGGHGLKEHLETYPEFVKNGGSYDIPKDQYEKLTELLDKLKNNPSQLSRTDYTLACKIQSFLDETGLDIHKDIHPAVADYSEVQTAVAKESVDHEEKSIKEEDQKQRKKAYDASKPTLKEGLKVAGIGAAVEGGVSFCLAVANKRKEKSFADFTSDDWKEIGLDTGAGAAKGGIRGGAIYIATNFTATPANVASAYVTAAFGIFHQVKELERGNVEQEDFIINCEAVCLDATVSAIASLAGQILIPIPCLGAIIGNIAGEFVYSLCKKYGAEKEQKIIESYHQEMSCLNCQLDAKLLKVVIEVTTLLQKFKDLEKMAFDEDVNTAFLKSGELACFVGVPEEKVLQSKADIDNYFM